MSKSMPNNSMQRTALRAAADAERWAASRGTQIWRYRIISQKNATGFAKRLSRLLMVPSYRTVGRFIHANCSDGFPVTLKFW